MVEIQKPHSALKRPSLKRETVVVNNSAPIKKVTLVPKDEELVAISPERRNWRGIFIALLVIAAVFSLIIFSIFLLSPEDEGLRIRGRRFILGDILGKTLQWKPFNGTWSSDAELVYRDPTGGLSILNLDNHTTRVLMTNSTFRQLNAESFVVSPDQKYVLLISDSNANGARHHVYEVQTANTFPLGPTENIAEAPHLQYVIWAPSNSLPAPSSTLPQQSSPILALPLTNSIPQSIQQQQKQQFLLQQQYKQQHQQMSKNQNNIETFSTASSSSSSSMAAKASPATAKSSSSSSSSSSLSSAGDGTAGGSGNAGNGDGGSAGILLNNIKAAAIAGKPTPYNYQSSSNGANNLRALAQNQAIAFVHENDIYYKPKVQGDLVCRITTTGTAGLIYNGIPDWTYENVPELDSRQKSLEFSPDGLYLAFLTFNDSDVMEYKYTWMADETKYPAVLTQRYPKAGTVNPNVTVNVVNLSVLKYIFPTQIKLPSELLNGSYIGGLTWASPIDLSVTITNRGQTNASTVVCRAPDFYCQIVHTEGTFNDGWVLPSEKPIFSNRISAQLKSVQQQLMQQQGLAYDYISSFHNLTNGQNTYEIKNGGYLLKRLPVLDGSHGHYRHVNFISSLDRRPVPLTMGRFEVTEIVGWDEKNEIVYFMAAPETRPGERHLYKISVKLNTTDGNRTYVTPSQLACLTCDNTASTFKLRKLPQVQYDDDYSNMYSNKVESESTTASTDESQEKNEDKDECHYERRNNCLYNKVYFSKDFSYYVQECLGPESPSVYLVDTKSNAKIYVLNAGDSLRHRLNQLALPQIRTFSVEISNGFHAQVRLYLPPGMREEEEVAFPLIIHIDAAPGSQLVSQKFHVDWNWYLSSQRSFIVAQIDGRGSGFQGELLRTQVHGKLGKPEVEDQLGVVAYLRDSLKFVDPSRICAYGWGYGGYATTMTLIEDSQQILQCGVAINPIVSFGYHYSFFTERYIPFKGEYLRALQEADLTMKAGNVKGKNLMLMHGTADTFVHQEHSLMLVRSLVDQQVKFRHQVYPDEDHGITKSLNHVYRTMEWYFDECFGPTDDGEWDPTGIFIFKQ